MAKVIQKTVEFKRISPKELFDIYMDSKKHAAAVEADASMSNKVGGKFWVFGRNQIRGKNLLVVPGRMIVQAWRDAQFKATDPDSILTLTFSKTRSGARINQVHANVPDQAYEGCSDGWDKYYWKSWKTYLEGKS